MSECETIGGDQLRAIDEVLAVLAPDLQHHLRTIKRCGPLKPVAGRPGESPLGIFALRMRAEDAGAVLTVLEEALERYGHQHRFGDRALGMVVGSWKLRVQRLREAPRTLPPAD